MNDDPIQQATEYLPKRGILPETAAAHQVEVVHSPTCEQLVKWLGKNSQQLEAAVVFPNLILDDDGTIYPKGYSVRCFPPATRADGTSAKFLATLGIEYHPYILPPVWDVSSNTGEPVYIVEKQTAALLLQQVGKNVVALDGTWGAAAKRVEGEPARLHNVLARFDWIGRPVYLCFDRDFRNRVSVLQGLVRAYTLWAIAGAVVKVLQWQDYTGLDDYIAAKAQLKISRQREELDALTATVSELSTQGAAELWIIPEYRPLFEREIVAIQPLMSDRSRLAEAIFKALGTTAGDLKKSWGISTREPEAPPERPVLVEETEPSPNPVKPLEVAEKILARLKTHLITSPENYYALTLHPIVVALKEHLSLLPFLVVTSAVKRCGKTRLLELIARLCPRSLLAASVTPASTLRVIDALEPCFIMDEFDAFLAENEEFRGLLNTCHTKGLVHIRCAPETHEPQGFDTFCPIIIASIGELPVTVMDRAIHIRLERKWSSRKVVSVRKVPQGPFTLLRQEIVRLARDFAEQILEADFFLPEFTNDRAEENWEIHAKIATVLGGPWPARIFHAAGVLTPSDSDEQSLAIQLLLSLRRLFQNLRLHTPEKEETRHPTEQIVATLNLEKQALWQDKKLYPTGLTAMRLGIELRKFGVKSSRQCIEHEKWGPMGYCWKALVPSFKRYLDGEDPDPPPPPPKRGPIPPENPSPADPKPVSTDKPSDSPNQACHPVTRNASASESTTKVVTGLSETKSTSEQACHQTTPTTPTTCVEGDRVTGLKPEMRVFVVAAPPPSTPAAGFCVPTNPERKIGVDLETFYPWPSEGEITAQERRRRKDGKAHLSAKDPRRNAIRLLTVNTGTEVKVFDLFTETVPDDIRDLLRNSTVIVHNADFDVTVLRRHGFEVSSSIFDTLLASQLLSLGEVEPKRRKPKSPESSEEDFGDDEEETEFEKTYVLVSNDLSAVVERFLGVTMEKATTKLGGSDWSAPLSQAQVDYARDDVAHFHALEIKLTEELHKAGQWKNFQERSEFLVHLNNVKFAGIPVDREMLLADKVASEELITTTRSELREMFKDYRPEIPKSRRKKSKLKTIGADGAAVFDATPKTEEINPGYHVHVKAALAAHGIEVENTQKATLSAIDSPETRGFCHYAEQTKLLSIIKGIEKSIFHDGRVRSAQWNQLVARSGRIIPRGPNVQQLPRKWRKPFRVLPPRFWLKMDLSQIEIYILAIHCQCPYLIELLGKGKDVYVLIAAQIFGKKPRRGEGENEVSETLREITKTLTLGIAYCLMYRSFIRRVEIATRPSFGVGGVLYSVEEAKEFYTKFFEMFPEVKFYQDRMFEDALTEDFVYTATGQRRYLPPLLDDQEPDGYWPSRSYRHRVLVNTPIQGGAACHYIRSVNKFVPRLPAPVELIHLVHDEAGLLVTAETAQTTTQVVTQAFQEAFAEIFGTQLTVKLEAQLSDSWAKLPKEKK